MSKTYRKLTDEQLALIAAAYKQGAMDSISVSNKILKGMAELAAKEEADGVASVLEPIADGLKNIAIKQLKLLPDKEIIKALEMIREEVELEATKTKTMH
jgi:hypothetical protein